MKHSRRSTINIRVKRGDLATYKGNCFIGVDAGSTTTKVALVGSNGELLYDFYSSNNGSPLNTTIRAIKDIYSQAAGGCCTSLGSCSTGYGEALIKAGTVCLMLAK